MFATDDALDSIEDLERFRLVTSFFRAFGAAEGGPVVFADARIAVFESISGAQGYLRDSLRDLESLEGNELEGWGGFESVERLTAPVVGEARGYWVATMVAPLNGTNPQLTTDVIAFRRDRLVFISYVLHDETADVLTSLTSIARTVDASIRARLAGSFQS